MKPKKSLIVGAHSDDIAIGCSVLIKRDPLLMSVVTIANGVNKGGSYPITLGSVELKNEVDYIKQRLAEDRRAMRYLGLKETNCFSFELPNEKLHLYIREIIKRLSSIAHSRGIERIITQAFPEAHPDHEVVSFCSHKVANSLGIEVWEYPLYRMFEGKYKDRQLQEEDYSKIVRIDYSDEESLVREKVLKLFESQDFICERFKGRIEMFGRVNRNFNNLGNGAYFYKNDPNHPTPEEIRKSIRDFLGS